MSAAAAEGSQPAPELRLVWEPLEIGSTRVKNRIMMTAQTTLFGRDNVLGDRHIEFFRERAKGGAALFITEQQAGHRISKGSFFEGCSAWEKRAIPQYAKLAEAVHEHGARQFVQLFGCGVHDKGTMIMDEWHPLWGVSKMPSIVHHEMPMVMEQEHVDDVVKGFAESALNVKVAGCDGVELHAAHSYLLGQFLSPAFNDRTDRYGGSVRDRCQVILEIGEAVRTLVGDDFTVGVRLSFDEFMGDAGITPDQSEEQLEVLSTSGFFDFFNISGGGYYTLHRAVSPMNIENGFMLPFAKRAKAVVGNRAKVFAVGRIIDLQQAERALAAGDTDMVAMTRAQMAEPHLIKKTREGRQKEIRRCMGANECVARLFDNRQVTCAVNPSVGREAKWGSETLRRVAPEEAKSIVVVGGGIAGMKTAAVAGSRGHRVVLLEREQRLGGHVNLLMALPTRKEWGTAIDNLIRAMEVAAVDVRLGVEATPDVIERETPDAVVVATGARWDCDGRSQFRPGQMRLPGTEQENVIDVGTATARALADARALGQRVVILEETGFYLPLGLAEILAAAGIEVEILTPRAMVGEDVMRTLDLSYVMPRLEEAGVRCSGHMNVERIEGSTVHVRSVWGTRSRAIEGVDTVVISMLRSPDDALFRALEGRIADLHRVGDVVAPRRPIQSMYEGEELGRAL
ncbi:MAG: FAD-dependent oxidoreductase [Rhodospirillales bacterium]|nr:FAD-dependent oxidoreductase [Rhodospirillales bacterium]MDE0379002.1 FAD-dependent oxidoreductase [Rhodospirillales bacterium]